MSPLREERKIPTYTADGRRWRYATIEVAEYWLSLKLVVARRNRRGEIVCVQFLDDEGANPLSTTVHMGQHYSVRLKAGDLPYWEFKEFLRAKDRSNLLCSAGMTKEELERYLQSVFRAVPLSCMKRESKRKAPVTSIDSPPRFKRRKRPHRPEPPLLAA